MLKNQIQSDVKDALKQGNSKVAEVLRMAISAINTKEKDKRYALAKEKADMSEELLQKESVLSDDEIISVISSEIKKRKDAIALYEQGNRPELAEGEKEEIAILQKYLPEQIPADQLRKMIEESVSAVGATEMKDMGKVMADLAPKVKGKADNSEISKIVKELLTK